MLSVGRWLPLIVTLTLGTLLDWNLYTCLLAVIPYFAIYVAQIPWAVIAARKADEDYTLRWFNRASFYLGYALTMMVLSFSAALTTRARVVEAFKIPAGSMRPSIVPGDQVFVVKIGPLVSSYAPGDLIIFR
ncbi:MAG: S26 family signal peptidase, partial [Myxococcota bacterium]